MDAKSLILGGLGGAAAVLLVWTARQRWPFRPSHPVAAASGLVMGGGLVTRYRQFFSPLGELTIAFSLMEQTLDDAIRVVKGLEYPKAARRAVDDDIKTKIREFCNAAFREASSFPALKAEVQPILSGLDDARDRRNRAQHGPWLSIDLATGSAAKIGQRGKPFEWHDHTPESLEKDAKFCFEVAMRVGHWVSRFREEVQVPRNSRP